ncbi:hypothetical protein BCR35DRAFT_336598 [Leucosporidium creatinivorum]|uniref:F-box domain-containing protein n=1 Tax=Leucosporidium creatinivorum TaxID=106004 RepID=A0A1Y2BS27_9BASI|nr:hypothetical protein BCR35DRAFT_336598 [Leucosporidium creatinivorum]
MPTLPNEVITEIFSHLENCSETAEGFPGDRHTLAACALVSKRFRKLASDWLYQSLDLTFDAHRSESAVPLDLSTSLDVVDESGAEVVLGLLQQGSPYRTLLAGRGRGIAEELVLTVEPSNYYGTAISSSMLVMVFGMIALRLLELAPRVTTLRVYGGYSWQFGGLLQVAPYCLGRLKELQLAYLHSPEWEDFDPVPTLLGHTEIKLFDLLAKHSTSTLNFLRIVLPFDEELDLTRYDWLETLDIACGGPSRGQAAPLPSTTHPLLRWIPPSPSGIYYLTLRNVSIYHPLPIIPSYLRHLRLELAAEAHRPFAPSSRPFFDSLAACVGSHHIRRLSIYCTGERTVPNRVVYPPEHRETLAAVCEEKGTVLEDRLSHFLR